jgi:type IV pilus assembly protein PilO
VKPRRPVKRTAGAARSSNRAVIALAVMGGIVMLYAWNSVFLAPRSRAQAKVRKDLAAAQQQEQDLRQSLAQLRKVATDTQGREAELARLGRLVPTQPDVAGAIVALNDTANQAQVDWASLVPAPPTPGAAGGPASIALSIKVGGSFNQIFDYLRRLESLDRLVVVDSVSLTAAAANSGPPKLQAELKARMFAAGTASPVPATAVAAIPSGGTRTSGTSAAAVLPKAGG